MLKLSRAMVYRSYVRCCSAMLLDLCPKVLSPRNTKIWSGFWRAMFYRNILDPDWGQVWPSWALLRYLEATAMLLGAKLGDLEGKLGYRGAVFKPSWGILFDHFVVFAARNAQKCSPRGANFGDFEANFGDFGAVLKAIWDHFRPCYFGILKNITKNTSQKLIPMAGTSKRKTPGLQNGTPLAELLEMTMLFAKFLRNCCEWSAGEKRP